ncbi:hypothetical protein DOJK_01200 [Patescibacteria group bacterium]|nr:DUF2085 domain-containing protein [Candidatus Dojkabacteria bacterium]CAG1021728.1 hypothetical protein DOJK_01200 [Patescibacteria group bacterium]
MHKNSAYYKNFYNLYLGILTTLVALPILAPVLLRLGLELPAKMIYFVYSFFCHQFASRSIHLFDYQFAWCARDTGIWLAVAVVAWLLKFKIVKPIKWYWVIPFVIPIALDGGIQTAFTALNIEGASTLSNLPLYASNNLIRFVTGAFFGVGLSLWISGTFIEDAEPELKESQNTKAKNFIDVFKILQVKKVALIMAVLVTIYGASIQLWRLTSNEVLPTNTLDSVVKLQNLNFFERRADGVCPTSGVEDIFNWNCFFN